MTTRPGTVAAIGNGLFRASGVTLSIRRMLVGLGVLSVTAMLLLTTVAWLSNQRLASYQEELLEEAFPVSEAVRGIVVVVMRLADRRHQPVNPEIPVDSGRLFSRASLEAEFQAERHVLDKLLERFPASRETLGELDRDFGQLLRADDELSIRQGRWQELVATLTIRIGQLEHEAGEMIRNAEALAGKARLETQRARRRLKPLLTQEPWDDQTRRLIQESWIAALPDVREATDTIRHASLTLALLSRQLIMERAQDQLISIRANGMDQAFGVMRAALAQLQKSVHADSEWEPLFQELQLHFSRIPPLLTEGPDALYALLQMLFEEHAAWRVARGRMDLAAAQVLRDVERLSSPAGLLRGEIAADARQVVEKNHVTLIQVTLLAPLLLAGSILWFLRWLVGRSRQIVHALQGCAEGDYTRRVTLLGNGDQLDEIGSMVNMLASNLDRLENADIRGIMSRIALNALLETSLIPMSRQAYLLTALRIIRTIPWLKVWNNDVALFLVDPEQGGLHLAAQIGFSEDEQRACAVVPAGHCLCGAALQTRQILFAGDDDPRHVVTHSEARRHRHYCVPIFSSERPLGVLLLRLHADHARNPDEIALLATIANTLAGVIERKRMEEELQRLVHHDALTGLPNRMLFLEHARQLLATAQRTRESFSVLMLDLDRFKQVNDTLGHAAGDQLLIQVTQRLRHTLRGSDLLARLGGDEFALLICEQHNPLNIAIVAEKIVHALVEPFVILDTRCSIGVSIGIAFYPEHGASVDVLLERADQAMYWVKQNGRNGFGFARPVQVMEDPNTTE
ncbi:MAG: GGDEF domain-containing protein [Magnetococcales bacterium]|nr:GGDEF domain-containing protein [Magnetococcales bacterium]